THEATLPALAAAVRRYQVQHPVLNDPDLATWQSYGARAWPTLVLIDPEGHQVAHLSGEGHGSALAGMVAELVSEHQAGGTLKPGPGPYVPPTKPDTGLNFPSKVITLPSGDLLIADAGAHRIIGTSLEGRLVEAFGSGQRGLADGAAGRAQFSEPNGLCLLPAELAGRLGYDVVVADTVNHALRGLNLAYGQVKTIAGTGQQRSGARPGPALATGGGPALQTDLSSPWDVAWDPVRSLVLVAMAGVHQIWGFDLENDLVGVVAGTSGEGLIDGPALKAWLAQPSGLAVDQHGRCWFVDSETSALRWLDPDQTVHTAVGHGLFEFGLKDGRGANARMQHPLGLTITTQGQILIADTYNGAVRLYDTAKGSLSTVATGLHEASDVLEHKDLGPSQALVVESAAHRLTVVDYAKKVTTSLGAKGGPGPAGIARPMRGPDSQPENWGRPAMELPSGLVDLEIAFTVPPGRELDDSAGYPIEVKVDASPPELLQKGDGVTHHLSRRLELAPGVGVLHVTARVATCDKEAENPACHLNAQDWGLPIRVEKNSAQPASIQLPLG
ncbi:MAG: hypothetical protein FWG16_07205, partial [Micrococcales bacterium]|nr:hypothetical protein [Micrococcales bacterium]